MADGSSKSISLPPEMLEALGDYRAALKAAKNELRELEKEAKAAEKAGVPVGEAATNRRLLLGGQANRLESIVGKQKADAASIKNVMQSRNIVTDIGGRALGRAEMLQSRLQNLSGILRQSGMTRASTMVGRAAGLAGRGSAAIGQLMSSPGFAVAAGVGSAVTAGLAVAKGMHAWGKYSASVRMQGIAGDQRVSELINSYSSAAAYGTNARALDSYVNAVNQASLQGAAIGASASVTERLVSFLNNGYTKTGNELSTKMAEAAAMRQSGINKYGASFGRATSRQEVLRRRQTEIAATRDENYGAASNIVTSAARRLGIIDRTDVISGIDMLAASNPMGLGGAIRAIWGGGEAAELEKTIAEATVKEGNKFIEARKSEMSSFNTAFNFAVQRAKAHQRSSALRALEEDKLSRSATWRMQ